MLEVVFHVCFFGISVGAVNHCSIIRHILQIDKPAL